MGQRGSDTRQRQQGAGGIQDEVIETDERMEKRRRAEQKLTEDIKHKQRRISEKGRKI